MGFGFRVYRGPRLFAATGERGGGAGAAPLEPFAVETALAICGEGFVFSAGPPRGALEPLVLGEEDVRSVTWIVWASFPGRLPLSAVWWRGESLPGVLAVPGVGFGDEGLGFRV